MDATRETITPPLTLAWDYDVTGGIGKGSPLVVDSVLLVGNMRGELHGAGYSEIPLICALPAAVEMAKAMVNMKLVQAPRAYPSHALQAKPTFR